MHHENFRCKCSSSLGSVVSVVGDQLGELVYFVCDFCPAPPNSSLALSVLSEDRDYTVKYRPQVEI